MSGKPGMHKIRMEEEAVGESFRERLRAKINSTLLVKALTEHINGKREMSTTQVTAAMGLLRKTLPDLNSTEVIAQITTFTSVLDRIAALDHAQQAQIEHSPDITH